MRPRAPGIDVTVETGAERSDASINLNQAPFDDPKVVEAFRYVFDRQAFVDAVTGGLGSVTHQPFPEGYLAFNPEVEDLWDYDPAKARQILAEAGYADGDLSIGITAQAGGEVAAELAQAQLAVGVSSTITVVPAGSTTWQDEVYVAKSPQLALDGTIGRESPVANLLATYGPQGIMNLSGPHATAPSSSPRWTRCAPRPIDSPEYQQVLWDAVEIGVTQSPTNYLYSSPWIFATSDKVGDLNLLPSQVRWEGVEIDG